jgi:hypothetical protein
MNRAWKASLETGNSIQMAKDLHLLLEFLQSASAQLLDNELQAHFQLVLVELPKSQVKQMFQVETRTPTKMIKVHYMVGGKTWIMNQQSILTENCDMMVAKNGLKLTRRRNIRTQDTRLRTIQPTHAALL